MEFTPIGHQGCDDNSQSAERNAAFDEAAGDARSRDAVQGALDRRELTLAEVRYFNRASLTARASSEIAGLSLKRQLKQATVSDQIQPIQQCANGLFQHVLLIDCHHDNPTGKSGRWLGLIASAADTADGLPSILHTACSPAGLSRTERQS